MIPYTIIQFESCRFILQNQIYHNNTEQLKILSFQSIVLDIDKTLLIFILLSSYLFKLIAIVIRYYANMSNLCLKMSKFMFAELRTVGNIDFYQENSFLKVVLNRPKALNSVNLTMIKDLQSQLSSIQSNKAFWLEGAGGKAFCAGGDVKSLFDKASSIQNRLSFFRHQFTLDYKLSQIKTVQIANWDGIVMGGGFGLSAFAPFKIATENTLFAMPQCKLGFFPDVGSSYSLSRLRNNIGYYLGLTGSRLKGQQVYIAGLANYFIHHKDLPTAYNQIKEAISSCSDSKETIKKILDKYHRPSNKKTISNQQHINQIFGLNSFQAIYKRLSTDTDQFCQDTTKAIREQCPVSVGIAHRLISYAKSKSIKQCFLQDFNLCQHLILDPNFAQGVRTVLIDKGSVPNWSHKHITDVTQAQVDRYFQRPVTFQTLAL